MAQRLQELKKLIAGAVHSDDARALQDSALKMSSTSYWSYYIILYIHAIYGREEKDIL